MSATKELLNHLFKPAKILLMRSGNSADIESVLLSVCACAVTSVNSKASLKDISISEQPYDVVIIDMPEAVFDVLRQIQQCGPIVLTGQSLAWAKEACNFAPVLLVQKITEHAVRDMFRVLRLKMRTQEMVELINEVAPRRSVSDEFFARYSDALRVT